MGMAVMSKTEVKPYDVKDLNLAQEGKLRIEWAGDQMPVLAIIKNEFLKTKPLKGIKVAACLHVTSETANLMRVLKAGGAQISLCASNPLSTQDDVAASLVKHDGISVYAIKGVDSKRYYQHINWTLDCEPNITMDDGADLVTVLHTKRRNLLDNIIGGTEETTTGVIRLKSMEKDKKLMYPIIAVNNAKTKHFFDNRYGTGQSTIDGILRATNVLLAGKYFVVVGYGWCGRGLAMRASGMGAKVVVVEIDPLKALEAVMDGYEVMDMKAAAKIGEIFVTVTGNISVIRKEHFNLMKDGAIVANSGHFNVELDLESLAKMSDKRRKVKEFVEEFSFGDKRVYVLAEGRLINLAAAEGHPAQVMDMSFANQSLSAEFLVSAAKELEKKVYDVPEAIDKEIARLKLNSMDVGLEKLTPEQKKYLASWHMGT